ncbi:riboflavin synthase [Kordiimonas sp. SCSIO 12610]|uniref:riboflavin synthase n=1 Tax=Kordiimonas sp. SCSIO 12610 TaxID=2829597 RepID=UPI00210E019B|nr:riboflavin synthase [Kordiimonas sp. SCSIO 12610]UTW54122.1 riboflavin synthase [Kordiimonas sp. SCSIO 12610]
MFTGIVTDVGKVRSTEKKGDMRAVIETSYDMAGVDIGASIACAGVCLTVVEKGEGWFAADISDETLRVTNLGSWVEGTLVNLERSLAVGDELGGHIVTGHVDCLGRIVRFENVGDSIAMDIEIDGSHGKYVASKGSAAINGTSLTVNAVTDIADKTVMSINLIPHTQSVTSYKSSSVGDQVNVEFDILARYVARLNEKA